MGTLMTQAIESGMESWEPVNSLFASWRPSLLRYARRLCDVPELAEDLVQEAFLALYRKSLRGENIRNPKRWTLCVVRHQAFKQQRDRRRHREELQPRDVLEAVAACETSHAGGATYGDVSRLLWVLTPRERQVFLLRIQSMKYQEIATQLDISPKTVSTLLARACHKLRDAVDGADQPSGSRPITSSI